MSASPPGRGRSDSNNRRTTSLTSILKRTRSSDLLGERKNSSDLLRQQSLEPDRDELSYRQAERLDTPPKLPTFSPQPVLQTFGGDDYIPKAPQPTNNGPNGTSSTSRLPTTMEGNATDTHSRSESMTHRGRYSYAHTSISSLNSPRRIRRRKDPTPYNVLVVGARNSGKTSFLNFLKSSLELLSSKQPQRPAEVAFQPPSLKLHPSYVQCYQEIEIDNDRVGLTLWDSPGLERTIADLQLRELNAFVESKFEDTFIEEMKVVRAPGFRDTHIHCVFLILDPVQLDSNIRASQETQNGTGSVTGKATRVIGALDVDFEIQLLKTLQGKTTVIPVISKADTITTAHMAYLKDMVLESLKQAGLDPLEALNIAMEESEDEESEEDDEDTDNSESDVPKTPASELAGTEEVEAPKAVPKPAKNIKPSISSTLLNNGHVPLSILSPDQYSLMPGQGPIGRRFPWGFADPHDPRHCDFLKLKEAAFREWRTNLREASAEVFYERWRTSRLNRKAEVSVVKPVIQPRKSSGGIPIILSGSKVR